MTTNAASAAQAPFSFTIRDAEVFGVGLERLTVRYDGGDDWDIAATATVPAPVPVSMPVAEAAAVAAHPFARNLMAQPWASAELRRAAVRAAVMLACPERA